MKSRAACAALCAMLWVGSCGTATTPIYQPGDVGARMTLEQHVDVPAFSNGDVSVTLSRFVENCSTKLLGQISERALETGFGLPAGQTLAVHVRVDRNTLGYSGSLSESRVFTTRAGADYKLKLVYSKAGYIVDIYEDGRKLPFKRPCTY